MRKCRKYDNNGDFYFWVHAYFCNCNLNLCRWQLPQTEHSVSASTANELRQDRHAPINPEKLKAAAEGLKQSRFSLSLCGQILISQYIQLLLAVSPVFDVKQKKELIKPLSFYEKQN